VTTDDDQGVPPLVAGGTLCGGYADRYGKALRVEGLRGAFWGRIRSASVGLGLHLWLRERKLEYRPKNSATVVEIARGQIVVGASYCMHRIFGGLVEKLSCVLW
jgi:hypothetical protein